MTAINEMIVVMMGPLFNVAFFAGLMMSAILWQVRVLCQEDLSSFLLLLWGRRACVFILFYEKGCA
jgi:hypothetical protein